MPINSRQLLFRIFFTLALAAPLIACSKKYSYKEDAVPEQISLTLRLKKLFQVTKLVCFGRYALAVPKEAQIVWGGTYFPSKISSFLGSVETLREKAEEDIEKIKYDDKGAEITYDKSGPIELSWQIRYFDSKAAKQLNLLFFNTYVSKGNIIFRLGNAVDEGQSEEQIAAVEESRSKSLHLRLDDGIILPTEGYCIEHAFMASSFYGDQEMVEIGIYLPSLPDVTFSISSNKDAYADYPNEEFEKEKREELSLLTRIRKAQEEQGTMYPQRIVLREGKRAVQHWHGEESLIKRLDGVHDFEWGFVGTPKDVANPSEFIVNMYTKVEHNLVGAAKKASVTDDEAVALWDRLLSGLKFRVKVPGAPEGSYYLPEHKSSTTNAE
ncbi:hypothetical protein IFT43_16965 [Oxalobacteraceae sp. CFBP 13708]|nr:hypothetical protein [Oxalobacteraceae sp. CFBP 13708]